MGAKPKETKVVDPIYGEFKIDKFFYELLLCPEVQRLRDVRQSNINSLFMPGVANVSRFEHSFGVGHLADLLSIHLRLDEYERKLLVAASILHDIGTPPFGHTMEYSLKKHFGFDHEDYATKVIKGDYSYQVFVGRFAGSPMVLKRHGVDAYEVTEIILGKGKLGKLLNSELDIDNIDNVIRTAVHTRSSNNRYDPIKLIKGFHFNKNDVVFLKENIEEIKRWLSTRREMYTDFFEDEHDWEAKVTLGYTINQAIQNGILNEDSWILTDNELLILLSDYLKISKLNFGYLFEKEFKNILKSNYPGDHPEKIFNNLNFLIYTKSDAKLKKFYSNIDKITNEHSNKNSKKDIENFLFWVSTEGGMNSLYKVLDYWINSNESEKSKTVVKDFGEIYYKKFRYFKESDKAQKLIKKILNLCEKNRLVSEDISQTIKKFRKGEVFENLTHFWADDEGEVNVIIENKDKIEDDIQKKVLEKIKKSKKYKVLKKDEKPLKFHYRIVLDFIPKNISKTVNLKIHDKSTGDINEGIIKSVEPMPTRWLLSICLKREKVTKLYEELLKEIDEREIQNLCQKVLSYNYNIRNLKIKETQEVLEKSTF